MHLSAGSTKARVLGSCCARLRARSRIGLIRLHAATPKSKSPEILLLRLISQPCSVLSLHFPHSTFPDISPEYKIRGKMGVEKDRRESLEDFRNNAHESSSAAQQIVREVGPSFITALVMLSLIFGGCCSNVF